MRKLGSVQRDVLNALVEHGEWCADGFNGWVWDSHSNTQRIMESLVRRGLVERRAIEIKRSMRHVGGSREYIEERIVYRPTKLGRIHADVRRDK